MWRRILGISLFAALVLSISAPAAEKNKKKKAVASPAAAIDADTLPPGDYTGKLMTTPGTDGSFTVEVSYQHLEQNPNYRPPHNNAKADNHVVNTLVKDQQRIAHLQKQVATAKKPQDAARAMQQLEQAMAKMTIQLAQAQVRGELKGEQALAHMFHVVTNTKTIGFHAGQNMHVRNLNLPTEYDDKGKPKKYTSEELRKLKGSNPNLPGYEGKVEDLQVGQTVKVTVVPTSSQAKKSDDKDKDPDSHKTNVSTVMVVKDNSDANTLSGTNKKGKK